MEATYSKVTAAALPDFLRSLRRALKPSAFALLLALGAAPAAAAPGDLDPSFSGDGKANTAFFTEAQASAAIHALAVQVDGRIVAAGTASRAQEPSVGTGSEFAIARYNADGSLDTSFSGDGKVTTDIAGGQDYAHGVAIQPDGRIVAVGSANLNAASFYTRFTIVRYTAAGALDSSFGSGGKVSTDFFGTENVARAVALQSDGKIVVAGYAHDGTANRFALARYNSDGSLDPAFGVGGKVTTSFFGFDDGAQALAIQPDGRIVVVGHAYPGGANDQFAVARYNPDGSLDPSFGTGGKVTTDFFGANDVGYAVVLQPGGKIVAAGMAYPAGSGIDQFALARYNADGSLDATFSGDGRATASFSSAYMRRLAAAGQDDGKIVAASWGVDGATGFDVFSVARFGADGELDAGFGVGGRVTTSILGSQNQALAVAIQGDGRILAAGSAFDTAASHSRFALARYQSGAGAPAISLTALAVNPASVAGGTASTGTVTLSGTAPTGGAQVTLSDNSPSVSAPPSVTVPAGATTASFSITTTAVAASTLATLTATHNGASRTATLTVTPPGASARLTVTATGRSGYNVLSSPAGINVRVGTSGSASFAAGTAITLSVSSSREAIWSGACSSGGRKARSCSFTISGNASVMANVQ